MAFVYAEPALAREHILRAAGAPVRRGRRAALVASAERPRRAHAVLGRPRLAAVRGRPLRARHRRRGGARRARCRSSRMRPLGAGRARGLRPARRSATRRGSVYEHCLRALRRACTDGRARPAADRHRRLERRDEPRRRRGQGRERVAGLVPDRRRCAASPSTCDARGDDGGARRAARPRRTRYVDGGGGARLGRRVVPPRLLRRRHAARLGAERRVPDRLDRAELERDLRRRRSRARRRRRCARSRSIWCARTRGCSCCSRRRSTRRRTIPATSRATCPACGRTARSTPTPRSGPCSPPRCRATATARSSCSRCSTRSRTRATPAEVATYKVEPYVVAADVYTAEGQLGRGGWTWYTGSASWMYRVGLEAILGFTKRGDTLPIDPRVPAAWPEFTHRVPVRKRGLRRGGRATPRGARRSAGGGARRTDARR